MAEETKPAPKKLDAPVAPAKQLKIKNLTSQIIYLTTNDGSSLALTPRQIIQVDESEKTHHFTLMAQRGYIALFSI